MAAAAAGGIGVASPDETWRALCDSAGTLLVDVRTRAEWAFVGGPDLAGARGALAMVEWTRFPDGAPNPAFSETVAQAAAEQGAQTVYFICRSGARSDAAARAMAARFASEGRAVACVNVAEGFEGDLDGEGRRGRLGGWKARGLPWRQS